MGIFKKKTEEKEAVKKNVNKSASSVKKTDSKKNSMKDLYSESEKQSKKTSNERKYGNAYKVLINPLVTEKASIEGALGKYTFEVAINTNKIEIAKAFEEVYSIKPISVNVIKMEGKRVTHGKSRGKRKNWKKAIITLAKGKSINLYEGV